MVLTIREGHQALNGSTRYTSSTGVYKMPSGWATGTERSMTGLMSQISNGHVKMWDSSCKDGATNQQSLLSHQSMSLGNIQIFRLWRTTIELRDRLWGKQIQTLPLCSMTPSTRMEQFGMICSLIMICKMSRWTITSTWHGKPQKLKSLTSATGLISCCWHQKCKKLSMICGSANGPLPLMSVACGLTGLTMSSKAFLSMIANTLSVLTATCPRPTTLTLIVQEMN